MERRSAEPVELFVGHRSAESLREALPPARILELPAELALGRSQSDLRQTVLTEALDAVLLDLEAADAREIDWLVIRVGARAERVEIFGARPPLEDVDPGGVHRIGRDREVEAPRCFAGEAHSTGTCHDMGVSVRWVEDEVTGDDEHLPIVPTGRDPVLIKQGRATARVARTLPSPR